MARKKKCSIIVALIPMPALGAALVGAVEFCFAVHLRKNLKSIPFCLENSRSRGVLIPGERHFVSGLLKPAGGGG
jgi:hypothetical protein